jgi:uncharacterized protein YecE (DUF72 family)
MPATMPARRTAPAPGPATEPAPPSPQQPSLFGEEAAPPAPAAPVPAGAVGPGPALPRRPPPGFPGKVAPAVPPPGLVALGAALRERFGGRLHLGTSSWNFPGWAGLVWAREHPESTVSREGLPAYAAHPLFTAVSLDRAFYRPLEAATYRRLAAQVPPHFRFVVKCAATVSDATVREPGSGEPLRPNPLFLDPAFAVEHCLRPAIEGLGDTFGAFVIQLSPLPVRWLRQPEDLHARLGALLAACRAELPPAVRLAVEPRDASLLNKAFAALLVQHGARCCIGVHDRMPTVAEQLPMQRAMWPGDLLCRWNLQRGQSYAGAKDAWAPFDRLQAPDPATREALVRAITGTLAAGFSAFVTINNKAEGSAPLTVQALAEALLGVEAPGPQPAAATASPSAG